MPGLPVLGLDPRNTGIQRCSHHAHKLDCRIKSGKDDGAGASVVAKRALAGAGFCGVVFVIEALPGYVAVRRGKIDE